MVIVDGCCPGNRRADLPGHDDASTAELPTGHQSREIDPRSDAVSPGVAGIPVDLVIACLIRLSAESLHDAARHVDDLDGRRPGLRHAEAQGGGLAEGIGSWYQRQGGWW